MLPTIILVFPLVMLYVWLTLINKDTKPNKQDDDSRDRCAYCDISHNIH